MLFHVKLNISVTIDGGQKPEGKTLGVWESAGKQAPSGVRCGKCQALDIGRICYQEHVRIFSRKVWVLNA